MRTISIRVTDARAVTLATTALAARLRTERHGELSLNQTAVLGRLLNCGPMTPGEVADQLRMLPQSLTRTFAALEAAGYVLRSPDPSDGRQSLLGCTSAGAAALRSEFASRTRWLQAAARSTLTEDDWTHLVRAAEIMQRLADVDADVAPVER